MLHIHSGFMSLCILVIMTLLFSSEAIAEDMLVGTINAEILADDDHFVYILNPETIKCDSFLLAFKEFDITGSAQLQIYDEGIIRPFFTCMACGNIVPPVFYSSTGSVTVLIDGVAGAGFNPSAFELQYVGQISVANDSRITLSHTNFNISLLMPYGHIRPVLMGGLYLAAHSQQTWVITVTAPTIKFYLGYLALEARSDGSCGAYLIIYDGLTPLSPVLYSGCNALSNPGKFLFSSSGHALVVLKSNSSTSIEADFLLDYIADDELYHCGSATTPDLLQSSSMTIVDGSKSSDLMRRGESCEWLVAPLTSSRVTLLMSWVSIKPGASVVVYDSGEESGVVLWDSAGTFTTVPPPLTSSGNSLYIVYTGNSLLATDYFGFSGDYYSRGAESWGTGAQQELYSMSSAIGVSLPDLVTGKYRELFSYSFLLQPLSATGSIFIIINLLNISDCDDSIRVYDGESISAPLLGTFCGTVAPHRWMEASSGSALLQFSSDSDQDRAGTLDFSFFSDGANYHCGFPTNPAILVSSSMTVTDGSSSAESLYGSQYCEWIIEPADCHGVVLYFERLDLSGGGGLKVYDGADTSAPLLLDISSVTAIPVLTSSVESNKMKLVYSSAAQELGGVPAGFGFSATYFIINRKVSGPGSDNVIKLRSSSLNSFGLPVPVNSSLSFANNYTFLINPPRSGNESLFIQVLNVSISQCSDSLQLFLGDKSELLAEFTCESTDDLAQIGFWLEVAGASVLLEFISLPTVAVTNDSKPLHTSSAFYATYFSEGSSQHCGVGTNPGRLRALSMPFSDGSGYNQHMHGGDHCEWIIESQHDGDSDEILHYVIEFSVNDLRGGGQLYVYDGASAAAELLWFCDECTELPDALVTSTNAAFIVFNSPSEEKVNDDSNLIGDGFHANYWAVKKSDDARINASPEDFMLMTLPAGYDFQPNAQPNGTAGWQLGLSEDMSNMLFAPSYSFHVTNDFNLSNQDHSYLDHSVKESKAPVASCGLVQGSKLTSLVTPVFTATAHQVARARIDTVSSTKRLVELVESYDAAAFNSDNYTTATKPVVAASTCTYILDSGSSFQSASLWIQGLNTRENGRLRVFGGVHGHDSLLLDVSHSTNEAASFFLPCGRGTVLLDSNVNTTDYSREGALLDYHFQMSYRLTPGDNGSDCARYIEDLFGGEKDESFFVKYASAFVILFLVAVLFCICVTCPERIPKSWKNMYRRNLTDLKKRYRVARAPRPHPAFTPKLDGFRNKYLLRKGECCVCRVHPVKVLKLSGCGHSLCLEDLNGYICAALGDVSMFPLKCPMHIDACLSIVAPLDAKRVLLEPQYQKFLEFTDRGRYGEGMRCIFCANYVKFPANTKLDQMRCTKCVQSFCIRCKRPWHYGRRCIVDAIDDTLESWKKASGAQKCPGCSKLIEKDDPETCHHMIHKVSDGIPCCRERTDFCYLCGVEVMPDYPHDEAKNPGVNHFPEGVFQRCRTLINKERDIEREFLRKSKRRQNSRMMSRVQPVSFEDSASLLTDVSDGEVANEVATVYNDPFEVMWADSPVRDRIEAEFSEYA